MRKKLKHEIGRLFKTKFLTDYPAQLYDVIAVAIPATGSVGLG